MRGENSSSKSCDNLSYSFTNFSPPIVFRRRVQNLGKKDTSHYHILSLYIRWRDDIFFHASIMEDGHRNSGFKSGRTEPAPPGRAAISASPRRRQGTGRLHRLARTARPGVFCEAEASDQLLAARPRQQDTALDGFGCSCSQA